MGWGRLQLCRPSRIVRRYPWVPPPSSPPHTNTPHLYTHASLRDLPIPSLQLCALVLRSLHLTLNLALATAQAASQLISTLATPLAQLLALAVQLGPSPQDAVLPALLQLYGLGLRVHAQCAGLHPEVWGRGGGSSEGTCLDTYVCWV